MKANNKKISGETPTTRRFQALFNSGLLTERDRSFLESLLSSYRSSGALTAGRRSALAKVEARISEAKVNPPTIDASSITRVESLISTGKLNSWGLSFANSVLSQAKVGRALSDNQLATIAKLEGEIKDQAAFSQSFTVEDRALFARAVTYYRSTGYFSNVIAAVDADPNYVPSKVIFAKMTENSFFKRVLAAEQEPAKFSEGDIVSLNKAIGNSARGMELMRQIRHKLGLDPYTARSPSEIRGMILVSDAAPVKSPVRGAKLYSVLLFGLSAPMNIEERDLRRSK